MTRVQDIPTAATATATGSTTSTDAPPQQHPDSRYGVMVNDHPNMRSLVTGLGMFALVGGVTAFGLMRSPMAKVAMVDHRMQIIAGSTAAAGALVAFLGTRIKPRFQPYMTGLIQSKQAAEELAARFPFDVAVHHHQSGKWGLISLEGKDVDNGGPEDSRIGNQNSVQWDAITSRDGDLYERAGTGWVNRGAFPGPLVGLSNLSPTDTAALAGIQIGTNSNHQAVTIGSRIGDADGYASAAAAGASLFEQRTDAAVLAHLGSRWFAFDETGAAWSDEVRARGSNYTPFSALNVMDGAHLETATRPGEEFAETSLPRDDISDDSAESLVGRRLGMQGGSIVRLGSVAGQYSTLEEAGEDAYHRGGGTHAILNVEGGYAAYDLQGGSLGHLSTLLGPNANVMVQSGKKVYVATGPESMRFLQRAVPFEVDEPIGSNVELNGVGGNVDRYVRSFSSRGDAMNWMRSTSYNDDAYVVISGKNDRGTYHLYEVRGNGGTSWDRELGPVEGAVESYYDERSETHSERHGDYVDTYRTDYERHWREFVDADHGSDTIYDTGWDRVGEVQTGHTYDPPYTPPPDSGGDSGGGGYGGGNSGGDSGGGYGGGNTGSDSGSGGGYGGGNVGPD